MILVLDMEDVLVSHYRQRGGYVRRFILAGLSGDVTAPLEKSLANSLVFIAPGLGDVIAAPLIGENKGLGSPLRGDQSRYMGTFSRPHHHQSAQQVRACRGEKSQSARESLLAARRISTQSS